MNPHNSTLPSIASLRRAVPYLRLFQGRVFVVKVGGACLEDEGELSALVEQIGILHQLGIRVILVHGGGPQTTRMAGQLGLSTQKVKGRRVTDAETRDVSMMVLNGLLSTRITAMGRRLGVPTLAISGVDAGLLQACRRPPVEVEGETIDFGFVGDIVSVRGHVIHRLLEEGFIPVVSPLSADNDGEVLNLNADGVAARLAWELHAAKLLVVTEAPGILEDVEKSDTLVSLVDLPGLEKLIANGAIQGGMLPKVAAVKEALTHGVERVHILSSKETDSILIEVFTNEGSGTMIVLDRKETVKEAAKVQEATR